MTGTATATPTPVARVAWRLLRQEPRAYGFALVMWLLFHGAPLPVGWVFKMVLDRVSDNAGAASPWTPLAVLGGLELARWAILVVAAVQWTGAWVGFQTRLRVRALESLARAPGAAAGRLPGSPGEAVSRFRDDTLDVAMVLDVWLDVTAIAIVTIAALAVMASIDPLVTAVVMVPVVIALAVSQWFSPRLRQWRLASRQATAKITAFLGDVFGAVLAVKASAAEPAVAARFSELNARRAGASLRDEVGSQVTYSISYATAEVGIGLLLLLVASKVRSGEFTVGDVGLFTSYLGALSAFPRWAGRLAAYQRQAEVSVRRLAELLPGADPLDVVSPVKTHLRHGPPPLVPDVSPGDPLRTLDVSGLTVRYPGGRGVEDVALHFERGELVVLTGPVGGGKSTTLRALLGLIDSDAGEIRWNGEPVSEPSTFFVPPRIAYVPQVPRLFSEAIADTVLLGLHPAGLDAAVWHACLEDDVAEMPDGLGTVVGPKGVRLSGGQLQRTAAARAFVRRPDLLVIDDLSSALDVETEARLWDRLLDQADRPTVLVVTHRPRVLAAADQVVTLDNGRLALATPAEL